MAARRARRRSPQSLGLVDDGITTVIQQRGVARIATATGTWPSG
jgi:hypothetical protein